MGTDVTKGRYRGMGPEGRAEAARERLLDAMSEFHKLGVQPPLKDVADVLDVDRTWMSKLASSFGGFQAIGGRRPGPVPVDEIVEVSS